MKKIILIVIAIILVAAIAVAVILLSGDKDKSPLKIESVHFRDMDYGIHTYLRCWNSDPQKEIDSYTFLIYPYVGNEVVKEFRHTDDSNIDAHGYSEEYVWYDYFPNSPYTYDDLTEVKIAISSYKFVGEDKVVIKDPFWKSFQP